jgi:hypothetical protein
MAPESASAVKFEIGHVLFIDIVGYSKLLITEQSEQLQTLKQSIRVAGNQRPTPGGYTPARGSPSSLYERLRKICKV